MQFEQECRLHDTIHQDWIWNRLKPGLYTLSYLHERGGAPGEVRSPAFRRRNRERGQGPGELPTRARTIERAVGSTGRDYEPAGAFVCPSPCLPVSLSPCLLVSP